MDEPIIENSVQRKLTWLQAAGFLLFSHGWTWFFWAAAAAQGDSVWEFPGILYFIAGGFGVPLGGVVMTGLALGRHGLWDLFKRTIDPLRIGLRWWAVLLLFFPLLTLLSAGVAFILGASDRPLDPATAIGYLGQPIQLLWFAAFLMLIGPLPEEIGWRGYLLDRLQSRWNAFASSLLVGFIWWSWHFPLFFLPGFFDAFNRETPSIAGILAGILPAAVLYTWIYNNTNRSVLAVVVFHFFENFSGEVFGLGAEVRTFRTAIMMLVAALVLWRYGHERLRRETFS